MQWPKEEDQTIQCPKEEGQTIQCPKEEGQTIECPREKRTNTDQQDHTQKLKIQQHEFH
jgi:hypothetical protein